MKILLNNREEEFVADSITVNEMLELKKYSFKMRIVKINGSLVPKEDYDKKRIRSGDDVKVLYLMSGG